MAGIGSASDGSAHLVARVRAVPEKGAANKALERLVARWLGVAPSAVAVAAGGKARLKTVNVSGNAVELAARVEELLTQG